MKRLLFLMMALVLTVCGSMTGRAASEVTDFRWVTRNDSAVPFVRMVLDVDRLPSIDAELNRDGTVLTVTLKKTEGKQVEGVYSLDPAIVSGVRVAQEKRNLVLTVQLPKATAKEDVKVFPLKADPAHQKPYRVVIDVYKVVPPPTFKTTAGLQDKVIVIDPGHGGTDTGAISAKNLYEKDVTLPIALHLKPILEERGATVILTRDGDYDVYGPHADAVSELQARVDIAERETADVFLSIHIDSFVRPNVGGVTTYYHRKTVFDETLAEALHDHTTRVDGFDDRGTRTANFYLLVNSTMPSALVELGFLSNPKEEAQLRKDNVRRAFAEQIADGLEEYFRRADRISR